MVLLLYTKGYYTRKNVPPINYFKDYFFGKR